MGTILHIGLIVYLVYIPIFALLMLLAVRRYKGYSFASYWASNLGDTRYPSSRIFNSALICYGFLSGFVIVGLVVVLPHTWISTLAIILMGITSFSIIMQGVIPFNKNIIIHHWFSEIMCGASLGLLLILICPLSLVRGFPHMLFILNAVIIFELILFAVAYIPIERKLGKVPYTFVEVRKQEKSFLSKNSALLEWAFAVLFVLWSVLMASILFQLTR